MGFSSKTLPKESSSWPPTPPEAEWDEDSGCVSRSFAIVAAGPATLRSLDPSLSASRPNVPLCSNVPSPVVPPAGELSFDPSPDPSLPRARFQRSRFSYSVVVGSPIHNRRLTPSVVTEKSSPRQLHYRMNQFATPKGVTMSPAPELKATLTLPQTAFPMKANLPHNEPLRLARWASLRLYDRSEEHTSELQ